MAKGRGARAPRWALFVVVVVAAYVFSGLRYGVAREGDQSLDLVFEVRDRIHRDYVDPVDSVRVVDAGIDGMLDLLPEERRQTPA